jgi:serine/threonine protein kinase/formylglycine-generating enzyme required for sulfatase activity
VSTPPSDPPRPADAAHPGQAAYTLVPDDDLFDTPIEDDLAEAPLPERPAFADGRYTVLATLGSGGMGRVHRVFDRTLRRVVALKVLRPERAHSVALLHRFTEEAQTTGQLSHPGIVPVYDAGRLPDGTPYYTMREVDGKSLTTAIIEAHRQTGPRRDTAVRRLIPAFLQVCEAIGFAHARNVVHRDLKPDNIMLGEFGAVTVVDWGLARALDAPAEPDLPDSTTSRPNLTGSGGFLGTPGYCPPEQAGEPDVPHTFASDVFSLGVVLFEVLTGKPPFGTAADQIQHRVREAASEAPPGHRSEHALWAICERATDPDPLQRYPDAGSLGEAISAWLDGAQAREEALALVQKARVLARRHDALRQDIDSLQDAVRHAQRDLTPASPVVRKRPVWELEDAVEDHRRQAALTEVELIGVLTTALERVPGLPSARALMAELHRHRLEDAEQARDAVEVWRHTALLRTYDDGRHAAFLRGTGRLWLVTDPPGATVELYRYDLQDRRLQAVPMGEVGVTPLQGVPIEMGSYLAILRAPGRIPVRYPIWIPRGHDWTGVAPGGRRAHPVHLPQEGEVGPHETYVPAGWAWSGSRGGIEAEHVLPARWLWHDGFTIWRTHVTNRLFIEFLDHLVASGHEAEALRWAPRERGGQPDTQGPVIYGRTPTGGFAVTPDADGDVWLPDWPVMMVDWHSARAHARWRASQDGLPWDLPGELQWEKAARGVDGRLYPWGDHFDATWTHSRLSQPDAPMPLPAASKPVDCSPYGVLDMAGNQRDWTLDAYRWEGPDCADGRARVYSSTDPEAMRVDRGGSWAETGHRLDRRDSNSATFRGPYRSFRLVRPLDPFAKG